MSRGNEAISVVVERLALTADIEADDATLQQLAESIVAAMDAWWEAARAWLKIVTGQHLTKIGLKTP